MTSSRNKRKKKSLYSIKAQFISVFALLMIITIVMCLVLNATLLGRYYQSQKKAALEKTYYNLNAAASSGDITGDDFDLQLQKAVSRENVDVIVLDPDSKTIKSYSMDTEQMIRRLYDNLLGVNQSISDEDARALEDESVTSEESATTTTYVIGVLDDEDNYTIQLVLDRRTKMRFMEMWGTLDNGYFFLLRTGIESISNSADTANRFFVFIGIISTVAGVLAAWYIAGRMTKPILELTAVSDRMKHLDFSAKYTGKDRTEIAKLGANINEMSDTLETTISELKTANNTLQEDIQKKEEIDNMRKEFLSNVTHELKTPIALIQGYAEGLEDCVNDDPADRDYYASVIVDEAGKMNAMVQKLLALNHLEFGAETVNMERFNIIDLISRYLQSATLLADKKDVKVRFPQEDQEIMVWADSFLVEEVFANYFSNACNHVEAIKDEKVIDINVVPDDISNSVRISVFNTGLPIPEDSLSHIWEKFYKVDKARTRAYGGSGIGLSIVKATMDLMHREYGVKNYNNGVEFWMELEKDKEKT